MASIRHTRTQLERLSCDGYVPEPLVLLKALPGWAPVDPRFDRLMRNCGVYTFDVMTDEWPWVSGCWYAIDDDGFAVLRPRGKDSPGILIAVTGPAGGIADFIVYDPRKPHGIHHVFGGGTFLGPTEPPFAEPGLVVCDDINAWFKLCGKAVYPLDHNAGRTLAETDVKLIVRDIQHARGLNDYLDGFDSANIIRRAR